MGVITSSLTSKPFSLSAWRIGEPPIIACIPAIIGLTSVTRPLASVERSTDARTEARTASTMFWRRLTSSSTPASDLR